MIANSVYRPLSSSECGVCTDGQGFAARPCPGCGKQKPTLEEIEAAKQRLEARRREVAEIQEEYFRRWKAKFRAQEARERAPSPASD